MPGSISNYLENAVLNHILKNTAYSQPTNIYVALSTTDAGEDGSTISEPSGNNYARALCNVWDTASNRQIKNTNQVTFNTATGSWGNILYWALFDSLSGGNMLAYGSFNTGKNIENGNTPFISAQEIIISVNSGGMTNYLANAILNHVFKNSALNQFTNLYVGLSTSNPTDTGVLTGEPVTSGYGRVLHNTWTVSVSGLSENSGAITFPEATGSWGTITHGFLVDNNIIGSGLMLLYAPLSTSQNITTGDIVEYPSGSYDISID